MRFSTSLLVLGLSLATRAASGAAPAPCQAIPAEAWSKIMGYTATATPGDGNCTYQSPDKASGGQFRIIANVSSSAEAAASAKRMREHQDHQPKGGHNAGLSVVDSQGTVVFSIALFQKAPTEGTPAQLEKLAAAAKEHLPK